MAHVPARPGLAIELDEVALEKAHQAYKNMASRPRGNDVGARDDAVAMQYLMPGWTFDNKRPCLVRQRHIVIPAEATPSFPRKRKSIPNMQYMPSVDSHFRRNDGNALPAALRACTSAHASGTPRPGTSA
jgi:hypothetical protein